MEKIELIDFMDEEDNYKLMYKWCNEPFIYEWFEQRKLSYEEIVSKYKKKLLSGKQHMFLISYNHHIIGYVQMYQYDGEKREGLDNYHHLYEYDLFIGEEKFLSKGLGTKIVHYLNDYIYHNYSCDCLVLRAFKRNNRAIKCYQKNGFVILHEYNDFDTVGHCEQMVMLIKPRSSL